MTGIRMIWMTVHVPFTCFRKGFAREFFETENFPPPSTVYGFLLSLVGEDDRNRYIGTRIAVGLINSPEKSVILRTSWRVKGKNPPGLGTNRRPDYQHILSNVYLTVWVEPGELSDRLYTVYYNPSEIDRYGGLSLGESRDLINEISWFPKNKSDIVNYLMPDEKGDIGLPVWVDHVGSENTVWNRFSLSSLAYDSPSRKNDIWITIKNR